MRLARHGFSLIEVLVAMVLLAGVGGAMIYAFSSTTQVAQSDYGIAYNIARGQIEQLAERVRQDTWGTAGLPLALQNVPARPAIAPKSLNGDTFTSTYTVNSNSGVAVDQNADGEEDFRRVTMTVSW